MANATTKPPSELSSQNVLRSAHNEVDGSITTNGFLVGQVGHKVTAALSTTTVANDTVTYTFLDGATVLYAIKMVFPTAQTLPFTSAERVI
jgi:hypothetical protein